MSPKVEYEDLVTGADIARRLGISRERVRQLGERGDFPVPLGRLGNYVVWRWADVEKWARSLNRPQRYLTQRSANYLFETEPATPGEIKVSNADGSHSGFAVAWLGTPILELDVDGDTLIVRTSRHAGRIGRNHMGTWALNDSHDRPSPEDANG
jgi:predicted DNA-binding transcriptional regulator AlpA